MSIATSQKTGMDFDQRSWPWFPIVMLHRVTAVTPASGIGHNIHRSTQSTLDMLRAGWGQMCKSICTGCCNRHTCLLDQRKCDWMRWHSQSHGFQTRSQLARHPSTFGQNESQRSRPEAARQNLRLVRPINNQIAGHGDARHMHNERRAARTLLDLIDTCDRYRVQCVRPEPVNSLRRKGDNTALSQECSPTGDQFGRGLHVNPVTRPCCRRPSCPSFYRPARHA